MIHIGLMITMSGIFSLSIIGMVLAVKKRQARKRRLDKAL